MDLLTLRLLLSFITGGTWVSVITWATVRYGAKVGGLLAGFPSTVALSLLFIGWTQSVETAVEATTAFPIALGFTASFPVIYAFLAARARFAASLLAALGLWCAAAVVLAAAVRFVGLTFAVSVTGFYATCILVFFLLARRQVLLVPGRGIRPTAFQWVWRFTLSGGIVFGAVYLSITQGPFIGGIFGSFPAIITSTLYIVNGTEGIEASRAIGTPVMVATMFTIAPYIMVVRYAFPLVGVFTGTLVGYAVAVPLSVAAFYLVIGMRS